MEPIAFIRKTIFRSTQAGFATIAGVSQGTVCKWEQGEFRPGQEHMERIRSAAAKRGLPWNDQWFFEPPNAAEIALPEPCAP